jgi:hypothetical protein
MNRNRVLLTAQKELDRLNDEAWNCLAESSDFLVSKVKREKAAKRFKLVTAQLKDFAGALVALSGGFFVEPLTEELQRHFIIFRHRARRKNGAA